MALLKQVKGVGTLIALTYLLTLEDPHRFELSALSRFRWELPECELFRRSKDDPQTGGKTSSGESVIVVLLISSTSHSA